MQRERTSTSLGNDDKVSMCGNFMTVATKKLSEQPLDSVARDCLPYLGAHSNAQPAFSLVVRFTEDNEMGGVNFSPSS